jgi:hypothetical protein
MNRTWTGRRGVKALQFKHRIPDGHHLQAKFAQLIISLSCRGAARDDQRHHARQLPPKAVAHRSAATEIRASLGVLL